MGVPTITEVRNYLGGLSSDRLGDATITINIGAAQIDVEMAKSDSAPENLVDKTYLVVTAYYAYRAYVAKLERTLGMVPAAAYNNMMLYKEDFDRFLAYVARGVGKTAIGPIMSYTPTIVPVTYEADAVGVA